MVTRDGRVKVLDFGRAKVAQGSALRRATAWPCGPHRRHVDLGRQTAAGVVMGTPADVSRMGERSWKIAVFETHARRHGSASAASTARRNDFASSAGYR
jgi:hypothetical protein